jgi:hypothetical protein
LLGTRGTFPTFSIKRGRGACWGSEMGLGKVTGFQLFTRIYIQPTNKLVSSLSRAPLVLRQAMGDSKLTKLTTTHTQGKPPPSPIYYTLQLSRRATSKWLFVSLGVPKFQQLGLGTLRAHNFLCKLPIAMKSEEKL